MTKHPEIDHKNYPKSLKSKSIVELEAIIKDCKETIRINPEGAKTGYYQDEINYCAMELKRRRG